LQNAKPHSLIITHHPLIFSKINALDFDKYPAMFIEKMIKKNISLISMHTNFDKTHLNEYVANKILKLNIDKKEDFVIYSDVGKIDFDEFALSVQKKLGLKFINVVKSKNKIKRIALTTGSGASLLPDIKADCFLTGDIKYHDAMLAKALGISMVDITHYASERYFCQILHSILKSNQIKAIIIHSKNPFIKFEEKQ